MALALVDRHGKPRLDVCTGVVELVRQRYRFAESIYYHKTKVSASAMFAKALSLIATLKELGQARQELYAVTDMQQLARSLIQNSAKLSEMKQACLPSALLDPEIGDDSLHLLLMYQAFERIEKTILASTAATKARDAKSKSESDQNTIVADCLRGIALLQGVLHRHLYKVSFSLNSDQFDSLTTRAGFEADGERRLELVLDRLRKNENGDHDERDEIERDMAVAAGWPIDSILLYVPPRKSQAKGIETLAFDADSVVRLNEHWAVKEKVKELGRDYQNLWRLLVLVHPYYSADTINLSNAVDVLVGRLRTICGGKESDIGLHEPGCIDAINKAAWFSYIQKERRDVAHRLLALASDPITKETPHDDWHLYLEAAVRSTENETTPPMVDHAERAYLLREIVSLHPRAAVVGDDALEDAVRIIRTQYPGPGSVETLQVEGTDVSLYEGQSLNADDLGRVRRALALQGLAKRLVEPEKPAQGNLALGVAGGNEGESGT